MLTKTCLGHESTRRFGLAGHGALAKIEAFVASYSTFVTCVVASSPFFVVVVVFVATIFVVVEFVIAFAPHVLVFPLASMQELHLFLFLLHQIRM